MNHYSYLTDLLHYRANTDPESTAYIFLKDGESEEIRLTYKELDIQAGLIAAFLQKILSKGDRALLLYPPGMDYITAFFGCLYAGIIAVPVYPPHPARPEKTMPRLMKIAENARPSAIMTTSFILQKMESFFQKNGSLGKIKSFATDAMQFSQDLTAEYKTPFINHDSIAFLQYTSGSTGNPKGVIVSHGCLIHNEQMIKNAFETNEKSVVAGWLPLYHDMGLIGNILQPLYAGFPCIFMSPLSFLQKPLRWLDTISRYKATISGGPNFAYDLCVKKISPEQMENLDLSTWEVAFNGSETVRADTLESFSKTFESCGFRKKAFYPCYGMAEATLFVSGGKKDELPEYLKVRKYGLEENRVIPVREKDENGLTLTGCGKISPEQELVIVNPDTLKPCQPDEVGEIWISGRSMAKGYWLQPEKTDEIFNARLYDGKGPFLRTGDLGFVREGELFITGRLKDVIIIRGRNHYPQDIEITVERSCHRLRPGGIAAFSVDIKGEERLIIAAEVERRHIKSIEEDHEKDNRRQFNVLPEYIPEDRFPLNAEEAVAAIREAVARHHELDVYGVVLLKVGSIPKTTSGKIKRYACKKGFLKGSLCVLESSISREYEVSDEKIVLDMDRFKAAPPAEQQIIMETYLKKLISAVMKTDISRLDSHRSLTGLGLDSIMAIELQHRMENDLCVSWPMISFFEGPAIAELTAQAVEKVLKEKGKQESELPVPASGSSSPDLSYNQQSMWFMHRLAPESAAYNVFFTLRILSGLDIQALKITFQTLLERHPSLRTVYYMRDGKPVQQIFEDMDVYFITIDASAWNEDELRSRLNREAHQSFDLEKGPVFRVMIFIRPQGSVLLVNVHHIATDLWSFAVLADELGKIYAAETRISGHEKQKQIPPESHFSYADYIRWQSRMLTSAEGERLWSYWKEKLSGDLPVLNLQTDHPRAPVQTYKGAVYGFSLNEELTKKIKDAARKFDVTLYTILLAGFQILLSRYGSQKDILAGSPVSGRTRAEFQEIVGYFVNPLAMRADLSENPSVIEFLARMRRTVSEALAYQDYPFQLLIERLKPERDASRSPIFQVMFVFQKNPRLELPAPFIMKESGGKADIGGLIIESMGIEERISQFDLTLTMSEDENRISAAFEYNTDLFDKSTIKRMSGHLKILFESMISAPETRVSLLPLLSRNEKNKILNQWNETNAEYPRHKTLSYLFEEQAAKTPDNRAVVFENTVLSYKDLNEKANQTAHFLKDKYNIMPDDRVGLLLNRSEQAVTGILGILKAGGAYVPIDPGYPAERIQYIITDSGCKAVLSEAEILNHLNLKGEFTDIRSIFHENRANPPQTASYHNLAYVIYTSGSTGQPKGVLIEHKSVVNMAWGLREVLYKPFNGGIVREAMTAPLIFDVSVQQVFSCLFQGNTLYVIPDEIRYSPRMFTDFLSREKINLIDVTPGFFISMMEIGDHGLPESILHVNMGAEVLPPVLIKKFYENKAHSHISLANIYGPAECCVNALNFHINSDFSTENISSVPIGKPMPNIQVFILDENLNPVPEGVSGEICLAGEGLARGYLNREALTKEKFIPHPFEKGKYLYKTGDKGRWLAHGNIEFMGRNDDQVKIRGFRIELGEIENRLREHESVRDAAVTAICRDNACLVSAVQDKMLAAHVETSEKLNASELRVHLKAALPDYMIPAYFIFTEKLPVTPSGKIDKKALPAPEGIRPDLETAYVMPKNDIERYITEIWQDMLGLEKVGIHDNFFDLGGHSLLVIRVQVKLEEKFGKDIPVVSLFRYPTIASLARYIGSETDEDLTALQHKVQDRAEKKKAAIKRRHKSRKDKSHGNK